MREGEKTFTARSLRKHESFAERRMWEQLRSRRLDGVKFVRQAPVGRYIADFLCRESKFIVEIDGATHSTAAEVSHDAARTRHLVDLGYRVIRFQNDEVMNGMDEVLTMIRSALARCPSPIPSLRDGPLSSPAGGRGHAKVLS